MIKYFINTVDYTKRNKGLDLIRAIAILWVVFYHGYIFVSHFITDGRMPFYLGYWGVELFFILSGFLIGGILLNLILKHKGLSFKDMVSFWKKRWLRTIPVYLIALLINFCFLKYFIGLQIVFNWKYLYFVQNLYSAHPPFFPEAWSLSVEEWFYFSIPILLALAIQMPYKSIIKRVFSTIIFLLIVYTCLRFLKADLFLDLSQWDKNIRKIVMFRLDAILYGVLMAALSIVYPQELRTHKNRLLIIGTLLVLLSYIYFQTQSNALFNNVFFPGLSSVGFSMCLPFFYSLKINSERLSHFISFLAIISYSIYLTHYTLVFKLMNTYLLGDTLFKSFLLYAAYIVLTIVTGALFYWFFERPILKLKGLIK